MTTPPDLALLRIVAQRLVGQDQATALEVVRWLTALQAQRFDGALTSIALRTQEHTREQVVAAFNAGDMVKSWPMRGTLHVVAAEDLGWILQLTSPRILAGAARRRARPAAGARRARTSCWRRCTGTLAPPGCCPGC